MSSKFLRRVEIMVWARFLSTYNNKKMTTVLIELSIIPNSPHPFFYAYSVSTHIIHGLLYQSHCRHEDHDFYHVTKKKKKNGLKKSSRKIATTVIGIELLLCIFLGNIHGNGQPHGILWEPYVYLQTPLWEGIPLTITVPPPSGPTRYEGEI